jgi:hypothetical protein
VRGDGDSLFLYKRKQLNSTGLDDRLRVECDLGPTPAVLSERSPFPTEQPDTARRKAGESSAPGGSVLYHRGQPDVRKGFSHQSG